MAIDVKTLNNNLDARFSLKAPFDAFDSKKLVGEVEGYQKEQHLGYPLVYGNFYKLDPETTSTFIKVDSKEAFDYAVDKDKKIVYSKYFCLGNSLDKQYPLYIKLYNRKNSGAIAPLLASFGFSCAGIAATGDHAVCLCNLTDALTGNESSIYIRIADAPGTGNKILQKFRLAQYKGGSTTTWETSSKNSYELFGSTSGWHKLIVNYFIKNNKMQIKLWLDGIEVELEEPATQLTSSYGGHEFIFGNYLSKYPNMDLCYTKFKDIRIYKLKCDEELAEFLALANSISIYPDGTMYIRAVGETDGIVSNIDLRDYNSQSSTAAFSGLQEESGMSEAQFEMGLNGTKIKNIKEY